jgi:hypothetical protein
MTTKITKTGIADCYVENGILFTIFTVKEMTLDQLKAHNEIVKSAFSHLYPLVSLVDSRSIINSSKEVRDYGAKEIDAAATVAVAVIVGSTLNKIAMNLIMTFSKPKYPIKAFNDQATALKWLEQYKK